MARIQLFLFVVADTMTSIPLNLQNLNGKNGFILNGNGHDSKFGQRVQNAGDFNGDGLNDFIVNDQTQSYLIFGRTDRTQRVLNIENLTEQDGITWENRSFTIASTGDLNGDGLDDLVFRGGLMPAETNDYVPRAFVVFGRPEGFTENFNLSNLNGRNGYQLSTNGGPSLSSISASGDINGDGIADLALTLSNRESGHIAVLYGKEQRTVPRLSLNKLNGRNGFSIVGEELTARSVQIDSSGDINGDGLADIIIGITPHNGRKGRSYVVFGSHQQAEEINLADLDGTNGFELTANDDFDLLGRSVSNAGDINGDGLHDLVIGAPLASQSRFIGTEGKTYVVFGTDQGFDQTVDLSTLDGENGFVFKGTQFSPFNSHFGPRGELSGFSVSSAGDVNNDGFDDIAIGAPWAAKRNKSAAGSGYVIFGQAEGFAPELDLSDLDSRTGFEVFGAEQFNDTGRSVDIIQDVNGDGIDDFLIGAPTAPARGQGQSYVVFGRQQQANEVREGSARRDVLLGFGGQDTLFGFSGDDVLKGGAGDDVLRAGIGDDLLQGGDGRDRLLGARGNDRLIGGHGNDTLVGGAGADEFLFQTLNQGRDRILDFEVNEDTLLLKRVGFESYFIDGQLSESQFVVGSQALDEGDRLIYNDQTGLLTFDSNGSQAGGEFELAELTSGLNLSISNIQLL